MILGGTGMLQCSRKKNPDRCPRRMGNINADWCGNICGGFLFYHSSKRIVYVKEEFTRLLFFAIMYLTLYEI